MSQYGLEVPAYYIRDLYRAINHDYCSFHQSHRRSNHIDRIDALYFVSKHMRPSLPLSDQQWNQVEQLQVQRLELQAQSQSSVGSRILSLVNLHSSTIELRQIESELESLLSL